MAQVIDQEMSKILLISQLNRTLSQLKSNNIIEIGNTQQIKNQPPTINNQNDRRQKSQAPSTSGNAQFAQKGRLGGGGGTLAPWPLDSGRLQDRARNCRSRKQLGFSRAGHRHQYCNRKNDVSNAGSDRRI